MTSQVLDQIAEAERYKAEGNDRFKEANYKRALGAYHKVFCYVNGLTLPGEKTQASAQLEMMGKSGSEANNQVPIDRVEDVKKLKASTHLNMAACYLKLEEHQKCVDACGKSLELASSHHDGADGTHALASLASSPPASNKPGNGTPSACSLEPSASQGLSEERGNAPACPTAKPELLFEITNASAQMSMARCALDGDDEYGLAKIPVLPDSAPTLDTDICEDIL